MFQLAILDIKMFPLDGVFLLSEIKSRSPSTEVIMITAYPTIDTRNECMKKGFHLSDQARGYSGTEDHCRWLTVVSLRIPWRIKNLIAFSLT